MLWSVNNMQGLNILVCLNTGVSLVVVVYIYMFFPVVMLYLPVILQIKVIPTKLFSILLLTNKGLIQYIVSAIYSNIDWFEPHKLWFLLQIQLTIFLLFYQ